MAKVDWTQLIFVLGGLYLAVMLSVVSFFLWRLVAKRKSTPPERSRACSRSTNPRRRILTASLQQL